MAEPVRAGIYCRMSLAAMDDTTKVDDQERRCRDTAAHLGWEVHEVYQDNNRSAWKHGRKRPAWDRMIADIEAGKISGIVVYHGDRLLRTHEDLLVLINLARTRGIKLASPSGVRDIGSYDDQFILEIEASMAKRESANISRRRQGQYERWRREGKVRPGGRGGRAFGFATDGVTHLPVETKLVREAARRILAGESTGSIARAFAARGVVTPANSRMSEGTLRKMLARPRYAGLMPDGVSDAAWRPVLPRDTWELVRAELDLRARVTPRPHNAHKYLLSGIAECGTCGAGLQINAAHAAHKNRRAIAVYRCVNPDCERKLHRSQPLLDAFVTGAVVARLGDPVFQAAQIPEPDLASEILALIKQRDDVAEIIASYADRPESFAVLARGLDSINQRLGQARDRVAAAGARRVLGAHAGTTRAGFEALPLELRRSLVAGCYRVIVKPASKRGPWTEERFAGDVDLLKPVPPGRGGR